MVMVYACVFFLESIQKFQMLPLDINKFYLSVLYYLGIAICTYIDLYLIIRSLNRYTEVPQI